MSKTKSSMKIDQYLEQSLILSVNNCYHALLRKMNSKLKREKCNLLESIILISLFFEPADSVIPSALAERLGTTRGNVSHCISKLEKLGLIKRQLDEKDARKYCLVLKPDGKKATLRLMKIIDEFENYLEDQVGSQNAAKLITTLQGLVFT